MTQPIEPLQVQLKDASLMLSVPVPTLRDMIATGRLQHVRVGKKLYIPMHEIRRLSTPVLRGEAAE